MTRLGAGRRASAGSISVPARHAPQAIELLADVVQHADDPGRRARDRARDRARRPRRAARRHVPLSGAAGDAGGVRRPSVRRARRRATSARCRDHARTMLRDWHRDARARGAGVIAVVGDAEPDELAALAAGAFGELRGGEIAPLAAPAWPAALVQRVEQREKAQTALALMFPGPSRADDARFATAMIAGVASGLGGRFFDELRDKQSLGYTVHAFATERALAGAFVALHRDVAGEGGDRAPRTARRVREAARGAGDRRGAGAGEDVRARHARDPPAERRRGARRDGGRVAVRAAWPSWRSSSRGCAAVSAERDADGGAARTSTSRAAWKGSCGGDEGHCRTEYD